MSMKMHKVSRVVVDNDYVDYICDTCGAVCPREKNVEYADHRGWLYGYLTAANESRVDYCSRQCAAPQPERPYAAFFGGDQ